MTQQFIVIQKSHDEEAFQRRRLLVLLRRILHESLTLRRELASMLLKDHPALVGRQGRSLSAGTVRGSTAHVCQMSTGVLGPPSATVHLELQHNPTETTLAHEIRTDADPDTNAAAHLALPKIETALALIVESATANAKYVREIIREMSAIDDLYSCYSIRACRSR
jgi:hypothetical protein